jgi:hypothetical protein
LKITCALRGLKFNQLILYILNSEKFKRNRI